MESEAYHLLTATWEGPEYRFNKERKRKKAQKKRERSKRRKRGEREEREAKEESHTPPCSNISTNDCMMSPKREGANNANKGN